ncbi:hypothetical protein [Rhizobium leguminosarum]|uniref:hypothetical protein n=1 Tax=Rhizobium leguminosarum TaxID=384 RepID=UPI001A8E22B1|nr:hypothetical protein [Rhizobium leguminosarum]
MNRNLDPRLIERDTSPGLQEAYRLVGNELDQLRQARSVLDAQIQKAEAAQSYLRQLLQEPGSAHNNAIPATKRFHKGSMTAEVVERCTAILQEAGRPLDRSELLLKLEQTGYTLRAGNPARFVGRTLWGNPNFVHVPRHGYWITGKTWPRAD